MTAPAVRYARSGDVHIAYSVLGEGPIDIVFVGGSILSTLEYAWDGPPGAFFARLASFSRLITFDKRGTGLSDRGSEIFGLETRMDDVRAVLDAVGSERAGIMGVSEGGPMTLLFAATYPERTAAAIVYGGRANYAFPPDLEEQLPERESRWRDGTFFDHFYDAAVPSLAADSATRAWFSRLLRLSSSPRGYTNLLRMNAGIDVRPVLPSIRVPTLVLHRRGDMVVPVELGREIAELVPDARLVELPGEDHAWFVDPEQPIAEVERFLHEIRDRGDWDTPPPPDRVLATVLFTDIVDSTARAVALGDRAWRELILEHHARVRRQLARFRGREVDTAGDGFFASGFDGPARAIECACAIVESVQDLGIDIRAGVHTGECEVIDGKVGGIAVNIGARVAAHAAAGEVLVSSTVKDLVAGSGLEFEERGMHSLKGIPGEWRLYAVASAR